MDRGIQKISQVRPKETETVQSPVLDVGTHRPGVRSHPSVELARPGEGVSDTTRGAGDRVREVHGQEVRPHRLSRIRMHVRHGL